MKKISFLILSILGLSFLPFNAECCIDIDSDIAFGVGWRHDDLKYTAFVPATGLALAEEWTDLNSIVISGRGETLINESIYLRAEGDFGWMVNGNKRVAFFFPNAVFNTSIFGNTNGHVYDVSTALGYLFCASDQFSVTPLVGYAFSGQNFHDHYRPADIASTRAFYHLRWQNPWIGFNLAYSFCNWCTFLEYQHHFSSLRANITEFNIVQRFHLSNANGNEIYLGASYVMENDPFCNLPMHFDVIANYKNYVGQNGSGIAQNPFILKSARWNSGSIILNAVLEY